MSNRYTLATESALFSTLRRALALCALLVAMGGSAYGQSVATSFGRRFHVMFPDTTQNRLRVLFDQLQTTAQLSLVSLDSARVTITGPGFSRTVTVAPERSTTVALTASPSASGVFVDSVGVVQNLSFRVDADRPIGVTAYFATVFGAEAFTPLPVERWGTEYFAASLNQMWVYNAAQSEEINTVVPAPASLVVVAAEDNTDVTIETSTDVQGPQLRTITLDAGQTYLVETFPFTDATRIGRPDITGTRITATKPIGVLSGNTRTLGSFLNPLPREPLPWNAMANTTFEWLHPTSAHGHTFIYRQYSAVEERRTTEIVRVVGTSPGITTVTITNGGPPMSVSQGGHLDFPSTVFRNDTVPQPFAVRTDKPAQCFVFTGSYSKYIGNNDSARVEMETTTWSPAMGELVPRERWVTLARYSAPVYPGGMAHYIVIAADSGTTVLIDGDTAAFDPKPVVGTSYHHARIAVAPGDHTLRAIGGRFTATAFGQRSGYAAYRPSAATGGEDIDGIAAHPTVYLEILSLAYAMPVPGISEYTPEPDSLVMTRLDKCDSSVIVAERTKVAWTSSIMSASLDAGSINVDVAIDKTFIDRLHNGFRVRFRPIDDTRDASGSVTITNEAGQRWTIPYAYAAHTVSLSPASFDLLAVDAGVTTTIPLTLTNRKPFTTTVLDARLRHGDRGFVLQGRSIMPKPLASGGSFSLALEFTGAAAGTHYTDTLVIYSDCDSLVVPLSARTAPPDPAPFPLITGYDWGVRRVGTASDTLSFISNAGTLPFTVERIIVVNDPSGVFAVVPPMPVPQVGPAERTAVGIRFQPGGTGTFVAEILLVTTDGDSARAELRGSAVLASIDLSDVGPVDVCVGRAMDTVAVLTAAGTVGSRIDSFTVTSSANVRVEVDTAGMYLSRVIAPGASMNVRLRIVGLSAGAFDASVVAFAGAIGDSVARITGVVEQCVALEITATDHDFDSVLIAHTRDGRVELINTGDGDVTVTSVRLIDDVGGAFRLTQPSLPFVVAAGETRDIDVAFAPASLGPFTARIEYQTTAGIVYSHLRGVGTNLVVPAYIMRSYRGEPGSIQSIAVELRRDIDVAGADPIVVSVAYDTTLLDYLALIDTAVAQVGLSMISAAPGLVTFAMQPRVDTLRAGPIAALQFLVRITLKDSSELPLTMSSATPWIVFQTSPGLFVRFPWCGLAERLFEFTSIPLVLRPVRPNPVRSSALAEFAVPLDGHVELTVIDALGIERLRPIDAVMPAGAYEAFIPEGTLTRGAYLLRLRTSGLERVVRFVVE